MITIILFLVVIISAKAQDLKISKGEINVKNTKAGNDANFVGKIGNNYLFSSANPVGIGGGRYYENNPPKLYLIDKSGKVIASTDTKEQFSNAKITDVYLYDIITFGDKIICLYSSYQKSEKSKIFYLSEINSNTLSINFNNKILISKELSVAMYGIPVTAPIVLWDISDDKSKLAVSFSRYYHPQALPKDRPKTQYTLLKSFVFDGNLKVIKSNFFDVEPEKYYSKYYESYDMKVNNNGDVVTLLKYNIKQAKGPVAINSSIHITSGDDKVGKILDIKLPNNLLIRDNSVLEINDNYIIFTGMPSILEKNTYSLTVHSIIGYMNCILNFNGDILNSSINSFDNFEVDFPEIKGRDYKKQIDYKNTILFEDGSFMMISQLFKADIILAFYNKDGKRMWSRLINRKMDWDSFVATFYKKDSNDAYIIFNDKESGLATYLVRVDKQGNLSDKKVVASENMFFYGKQADDKEYIYHSGKDNIKYGIIEF